MKKGILLLALLIWFSCTLLLVISLVGMFLFIPGTCEPSTWMKIGIDLTDKFVE